MQKAKIKLSAAIALIISVLTGLIVTFFCLPRSAVFAEETADGDSKYTTVTEDLNNIVDGFNKDKYPQKDGDYSLKFLTAAVNKDNELLVYVYQPAASGDYLATSINIDTDGKGAYNYELELISSDTVFFKYKVKDLEFVYSKFARTAQIVSIFRKFINGVDKNDSGVSNGNTIVEVVYPVAYKVTIKEGIVTECKEVEVITITDKYIGFVRYKNGTERNFFSSVKNYVDAHFVAFSTDHQIDKLKYARVSFSTRSAKLVVDMNKVVEQRNTTYGDYSKNVVDLRYTDVVQSEKDGDKYDTYKFNRIQTSQEFMETEDITTEKYWGLWKTSAERLNDTARNEIKSKQFVLRFYETKYSYEQTAGVGTSLAVGGVDTFNSTEVSGVTILTLEYEVNGVTFRRNCVDNKQSGSKDPVNGDEKTEWVDPFKEIGDDFAKFIKTLLIIVAIAAVVYVIVKIIQANGGFVAVASGVKNKFNNAKQKFGNKAANPQNKQQNGEKRIDNGNVQIVINTTERSKGNGNKKK